MQKENVLQLIDEKLAQIEEAETKNKLNFNLNFGVHLHLYRQSPYLPPFLKKRKIVRRSILFNSFLLPLIMVLGQDHTWELFEANALKAVLQIFGTVVSTGLIFNYIILHTLVAYANSTQKDVKMLLLHDLRQKVEAMEETSDRVVQKTGVASA